jgi:endonuclease-8
MPEGPSIVILKESVEELRLEGATVRRVEGNTSIDKERMLNQQISSVRSWGKHFLISFPDFSLRVHFMLFGSYRINERKETPLRLSLGVDSGELNFYACSLKFIEGDLDEVYDWKADVMADEWDPALAERRLKAQAEESVCDVLLDQHIFSGVGNIIKNEVLYRIAVHPRNRVGDLPDEKLRALIQEARNYSFDFLRWKKEYTLKKNWLVHTKKSCALGHPVQKAYLGKTRRRTFYCDRCQELYEAPEASSHS